MSLADTLKTHEIDPLYFSQQRAEWKIPADKLYNSNIRIGNLALKGHTGTVFLDSVGMKSVIRAIHLYDGNTELDVIRNFSDWAVVKEFNNTNSNNVDSANKKHYTDLGFTHGSVVGENVAHLDLEVVRPLNTRHLTHQDAQSSPKLFLELETEFDMLMKVGSISTALFRDFRVVIEFNQLNAALFNGDTYNAALTIDKPVLLIDEILDPETAKQALAIFAKPIVWDAVELDVGRVQQEITAGVKQYTVRIGGFDGKVVSKMVVAKKPSESVSDSLKSQCSVRQAGEVFQVLVNGSKLMPYSGVDAPNMALGMLSDAMGEMNLNYNAHINGIARMVPGVGVSEEVYDMSGAFSMYGVNILDRVERLELEYSRDTTFNNARYRQALQLLCWGMVGKELQVTKDGYRISYA